MNKELWKPVTGYEGLYEVSNLGRVKSYKCSRIKILKGAKLKNIYTTFLLHGKRVKVHRLVAQEFIPNPNNFPFVCHIKEDLDENGLLYNGADNLFWGTAQDNIKDMYSKQRDNNHFKYNNPNKGKFGKDSKYSKVVLQYGLSGELIKEWLGVREVSRELLISVSSISNCCRGVRETAYGFKWKYK